MGTRGCLWAPTCISLLTGEALVSEHTGAAHYPAQKLPQAPWQVTSAFLTSLQVNPEGGIWLTQVACLCPRLHPWA